MHLVCGSIDMNLRTYYFVWIFLAWSMPAFAARNVLLIIADDLGTDSLRLYNSTAGATAPTPNLNALSANGIRFINAYACPVCSPTRAAMLTGRYGFRTGVGNVVSSAAGNALTAAEITLPEAIAAHSTLGIQCASFGKWHLSSGGPLQIANAPNAIGGWPHYAGSTAGVISSYSSWTKTTNGATSTSTVYATTDVVNDAVSWIQARAVANQRWMAWVAFNAPHTPFHTPPVSLHSYGSAPATNLLKYQAAVEAMDTEIGRLLAAVNLTETDVIFIGDNGTPSSVIRPPYDSTHAKDSLYEGGVRVPLIIRGPSVNQAGRATDALVHCVDIFRTVLDMLDVAIPASTLDSRSMVPILGNQSNATRSRLYSEKFDQSDAVVGGRIIRDDRYKLLRSNAGNDEFYDLQIDPAETTNLFAGGRAGLNVTQRARYDRLRFNFSDFSSLSSVAPVTHGIANGNFFLSVPDLANYRETLWTCSDLDYWAPAENVASAVQGGHATFSQAIDPAMPRKFFSVLRESE